MNRIAVIGCSAAGKSTLARLLGEHLGIEVIHLDKVLWKPGCKLTPPEDEPEVVAPLLEKPAWIIDGNYTASLPQRLQAADTVVLVDFSRPRCLARAMKRLFWHRGKTRPDMGAACPEEFNLEFLAWIWKYPHTERPKLLDNIRRHGSHARVVTLRSQREMDRWLKGIGRHKT